MRRSSMKGRALVMAPGGVDAFAYGPEYGGGGGDEADDADYAGDGAGVGDALEGVADELLGDGQDFGDVVGEPVLDRVGADEVADYGDHGEGEGNMEKSV